MINSWIQYQILLSAYQQEKFKISASGLLSYFVTVHRFRVQRLRVKAQGSKGYRNQPLSALGFKAFSSYATPQLGYFHRNYK